MGSRPVSGLPTKVALHKASSTYYPMLLNTREKGTNHGKWHQGVQAAGRRSTSQAAFTANRTLRQKLAGLCGDWRWCQVINITEHVHERVDRCDDQKQKIELAFLSSVKVVAEHISVGRSCATGRLIENERGNGSVALAVNAALLSNNRYF